METRKGQHYEHRGGRGGREDQCCTQQGKQDQNNKSIEAIKKKPAKRE